MLLFCGTPAVGQNQPATGRTTTGGQQSSLPQDSGKTDTNVAAGSSGQAAPQQKRPPYIHQVRVGFDISRIAFNRMFPSKQGYELQADYKLRKDLYLAAEAGFGKGNIDYDFLKYTTNGEFLRLGIEKSLFTPLSKQDFDIAFIGVRYGIGVGRRNEAQYFVPSPFGGKTKGISAAQDFVVHWAELTGGVKVELWKGLFAGWNVRGKFLINPKTFKELAPNYIPGYGKGDKNSIFDFNFYLSYALRWGKASQDAP
jgi:hypothetical protein